MKIHTLLLTLPLVFVAACGDDKKPATDAPVAVDAPVDAGTPDASCFTNPTTYNEIINACTTAQKVFKNPTLPLLGANGELPPLP